MSSCKRPGKRVGDLSYFENLFKHYLKSLIFRPSELFAAITILKASPNNLLIKAGPL